MKLYHGTSININEEYLKPHDPFPERDDYKTSVYMTDELLIALLYSINPLKIYFNDIAPEMIHPFSKQFDVLNYKIPHLFELYEGMFDEVYNRGSYVYIAEINNQKYTKDGHQYIFEEPVKINKKVYYENIFNELLKYQKENKLKIIYYKEFKQRYEKDDILDSVKYLYENCNDYEKEFFHKKFNI